MRSKWFKGLINEFAKHKHGTNTWYLLSLRNKMEMEKIHVLVSVYIF